MAEEIKKFYRSRTDRVLFGVCGGLGKYFSIDPVLFRLLFVLLFIMHGAGLFIYVVMVFVTPQEPKNSDSNSGKEDLGGEFNELADKVSQKAREISGEMKSDNEIDGPRNLLGAVIILFGLFFLVREFFPVAWIDTDAIWALAVIGIGLYIILKK